MKKREDGFFKSTWTTLIAPILVGIVLSYLARRLVIQITRFQISVGLTIIITLVFFIVMAIGFFLGMIYSFYLIVGLFTSQKPPLAIRIIANY